MVTPVATEVNRGGPCGLRVGLRAGTTRGDRAARACSGRPSGGRLGRLRGRGCGCAGAGRECNRGYEGNCAHRCHILELHCVPFRLLDSAGDQMRVDTPVHHAGWVGADPDAESMCGALPESAVLVNGRLTQGSRWVAAPILRADSADVIQVRGVCVSSATMPDFGCSAEMCSTENSPVESAPMRADFGRHGRAR